MSNIIAELWYGNLRPHEQFVPHNEEVKTLVHLIEKNRAALSATLTEEQRIALEKYDDCAAELSALLEQQLFCYGFRLGGRLMLETLTSSEEP